ncbi:MAG: ATP-binding cassette domain-containing protein [Patescibacteria group bacterium]
MATENHGNVIIRFDNVNFAYTEDRPILEEANASVRENAKVTVIGQNGAGKSTIFKMLMHAAHPETYTEYVPQQGAVNVRQGASLAMAEQVMRPEFLDLTILEYFATAFKEQKYNLPKLAQEVMDVVHLDLPQDRVIRALSGGQQARVLLAYALIQKPDILLLDEPTNNLDAEGIGNLTMFLILYDKTVLVISHDSEFLNSFTDGVLQLDVRTQKLEQYVGNYNDVTEQIAAQIEREEHKNAQLRKNIQDRKDKVNFFANKGGKMRKLASKLREEIEEDEENVIDVKRDDRTMREFTIPSQSWSAPIATITSLGIMVNGAPQQRPVDIKLWRRDRLQIVGPNGIGKSTLLTTLASGHAEGCQIDPEVRVGFYRQDFSGLDYNQTVYESLVKVLGNVGEPDPKLIYGTAAQFLLPSWLLQNRVGTLSEGQKGLLCYARFVLQEPGLLILDEPTNHINFRHLPVIAKAIEEFQGAIILVSHMPEFVSQIKFTQTLDLERLI